MAADCTFRFENLTDEQVEVQMGFPDTFGDADADASWPEPWMAAGFRAWVRGEEVEVRHADVAGAGSPEGPSMAAAWLWTVVVAPRERLEVRNTYRFGGLVSNGPIDACAWGLTPEPGRLPESWWAEQPRPSCGADPGDSTCESVTYVVTTGLTWGGRIGRADILIEMPAPTLPADVVAVPQATRITPTSVSWHFEDWEPQSDLGVIVLGHRVGWDAHESCSLGAGSPTPFHSVEQAKAWIAWAARNGVNRAAARLQRNAIHAAHGHSFRDRELRRFFESTTWYRARAASDVSALTDEEARIVAALRKYER